MADACSIMWFALWCLEHSQHLNHASSASTLLLGSTRQHGEASTQRCAWAMHLRVGANIQALLIAVSSKPAHKAQAESLVLSLCMRVKTVAGCC